MSKFSYPYDKRCQSPVPEEERYRGDIAYSTDDDDAIVFYQRYEAQAICSAVSVITDEEHTVAVYKGNKI